jgi:hypothetical protein
MLLVLGNARLEVNLRELGCLALAFVYTSFIWYMNRNYDRKLERDLRLGVCGDEF